MKASIVKLMVAFLMIGTMAGCASTGGGSENFDSMNDADTTSLYSVG